MLAEIEGDGLDASVMAPDIVQLTEHNAALLRRVADDVFDEPVEPERVAQYVASPGHLMALAESEGTVVGQVLGVVHRRPDKPTELYLDDLGVAPAFQRRGTATRPLSEVRRLGAERGCDELWAATEPDDERAQAFCRSPGLASRSVVVFEGTL